MQRRSQFLRIQNRGRRWVTPLLILLWLPAETEKSRIGITVSRKVAKQAVRRNRIKRWVREAFRLLPRSNRDAPRVDLVIIARPAAVTATQAEIFTLLHRFWSTQACRPG